MWQALLVSITQNIKSVELVQGLQQRKPCHFSGSLLPFFLFPSGFGFLFCLFVVVVLVFLNSTYIHFYLSGSKHGTASVQITMTEQHMVTITLLLFQNLTAPPPTIGSNFPSP